MNANQILTGLSHQMMDVQYQLDTTGSYVIPTTNLIDINKKILALLPDYDTYSFTDKELINDWIAIIQIAVRQGIVIDVVH